jgi:YhcH/YjgK/YiaL family protein
MVVDTLTNRHLYAGLGKRIAAALTLLSQEDFRAQATGRHEVDGANLFYLVQAYTTKNVREASWESHRKYLDVQYVVEGTERMGWAPVPSLQVTKPYDADKDAALYQGDGVFLTAGPGTFFLLWPDDGHMPGIAAGNPAPVRKVVAKVLLEGAM